MSDTATTTLDRTVQGQPFPAVGTYAFDVAHSTVQGQVKHLMVSKTRVLFKQFEGTITVAEDPAAASVEVTIQADSIDSRDEKRDGHLKSPDFLEVEQYPHITFRSTAVEPGWKVIGDLTIKDVTRQVVLDTEYLGTFKSPMGPTVAAWSAETTLNREDFDVTWNAPMETGGVLVGKDVKIELEIEAVLQEG